MAKDSIFMRTTRFSYYAHAVFGLLLSAAALFIGLALISYSPYDPSWAYYTNQTCVVGNWCGSFGANLAAFLMFLAGAASFWCVALLFFMAHTFLMTGSFKQEWDRVFAFILFLGVTAALFYAYGVDFFRSPYPGGMVGHGIYTKVHAWFGSVGGMLFLYTLMMVCIIILTRLSFAKNIAHWLVALRASRFGQWQKYAGNACAVVGHALYAPIAYVAQRTQTFFYTWFPHEEDIQQHVELETVVAENALPPKMPNSSEHSLDNASHEHDESIHAQTVINSIYTLPNLDAFAPRIVEGEVDASVVRAGKAQAALLEEKLARFGIDGRVVRIKRGPLVTLFEYKPDIDAKLSKIVNLADDLSLALQALSVRIIAPIPGTAVVGFEVAHGQRASVSLAACMREQNYASSGAQLPLLLGQDTVGKAVVVDLTRMPHLLVAGATGAGKSVLLNSMLMSLLCKCTPDELKLILIDPKRLEFSVYADIGHLLFPIVTDAKTAVRVLGFAVQEMESRYKAIAAVSARTLAEYNERVEPAQKLPRLVLIIDELADLMMTAGKLCEEHLARLTHMARAAGIHVVVATQRPSVDVITGVIKANFPSRIALRVPSKIDSRTILDCTGAEALLGQGDMLMLDAHDSMLKRVHGAYVSEKEIAAVTSHIRDQRGADYRELPSQITAENELDEGDEGLYDNVVTFVRSVDEVSTSLLQRKFRIGYNRAARFIERLEAHGLIMPSEGSKARKVLK